MKKIKLRDRKYLAEGYTANKFNTAPTPHKKEICGISEIVRQKPFQEKPHSPGHFLQ